MSNAGAAQGGACRVVGAEKLGRASGGAAQICTEIERAIKAARPGARYIIDVQVVSSARLLATGTVNGRELPEQNLASSDRDLTAGAIKRFARSIAEAAKAMR